MFSAVFGFLYTLLIQYLIPAIFAFGIIMFAYGIINYFVIGPGEEPKREEGRQQLLWTFLAFLAGLLLYALVWLFLAFIGWTTTTFSDVDVGEDVRLQRVPDVPLRNN